MSTGLTRQQALRVLQLPATADDEDIKRAYRRLAREHHPDRGGDPATFHELQRAYERLLEGGPLPPALVRGRPSRPHAGFTDPLAADVDSVDWSTDPPRAGSALDRHGLAVALAGEAEGPVHPVTATSRAPGARLNRLAGMLAGELTAQLRIGGVRDDRGRTVVRIEVRGSARGARRALDSATLEGVWLRTRGSSSTTLQTDLRPGDDRQATAVRTVDRVQTLLDQLDWPLPTWTMTSDG